MDIKEIAQTLKLKMQDPDDGRFDIGEFAEALIKSYKDELLKEVGEPTCWMTPDGEGWRMRTKPPEINTKLGWIEFYTSDQVAAAIIKATKPLEDQLASCEQRVAEACSAYMLNKNYNSLEFDRKYSAKEFCAGQKSTVEFLAKMIRSGEYRKFMKEV